MSKDPNSPFNWQTRSTPSVFAQDATFRPRAQGKSIGEAQSAAIERRIAAGESPGTLDGIGKRDKEREARMLAYRQFGTYSRAGMPKKKPNKHEK